MYKRHSVYTLVIDNKNMAKEIFLSYTSIKNKEGFVSKFREVLQSELIQKSGDIEVSIFQDSEEIRFGENFKEVLQKELSKAKVLVILFSPTWINSEWCRWEFEQFSKDSDRPIVLVKWDEIDEDIVKSDAKEVFDKLKKLHFLDWVGLKYKSWSEEEKRKTAEALAIVLKDHLKK